MKNSIKKLIILLLPLLFAVNLSFAQTPEMADRFRADGKIYVVVAIILIVLAGLIAYLFILDRKITRMERLLNEKKPSA